MITLQLTKAQCLEIIDALANQRADMRTMRDECRIERARGDLTVAILDSTEITETIRSALAEQQAALAA